MQSVKLSMWNSNKEVSHIKHKESNKVVIQIEHKEIKYISQSN